MYIVHEVYYDIELQLYFGSKRKRFNHKKEAVEYMDKMLPLGDRCYSFDLWNETRGKFISHKYKKYMELELY